MPSPLAKQSANVVPAMPAWYTFWPPAVGRGWPGAENAAATPAPTIVHRSNTVSSASIMTAVGAYTRLPPTETPVPASPAADGVPATASPRNTKPIQ